MSKARLQSRTGCMSCCAVRLASSNRRAELGEQRQSRGSVRLETKKLACALADMDLFCMVTRARNPSWRGKGKVQAWNTRTIKSARLRSRLAKWTEAATKNHQALRRRLGRLQVCCRSAASLNSKGAATAACTSCKSSAAKMALSSASVCC